MLLSDEQHFLIILYAIRHYDEKTDNIGILLFESVINEIITSVDTHMTTQDVFNEVIELYNFYNDFVKEKKIDLPLVNDETIDIIESCMNEVIRNVQKDETK